MTDAFIVIHIPMLAIPCVMVRYHASVNSRFVENENDGEVKRYLVK